MINQPALRYTVDEYQRLQVNVAEGISRHSGLHDAKISTIEDWVNNTLVVRLSAYVWSKHDVVEVSWPATWWDHLKQTLNQKFQCWFKVKLTIKSIYQVTVYPEISTKSPNQTLRIAKLDD